MKALLEKLWRGQPLLDEASWAGLRRRLVLAALGFAVLAGLQTTLVNSPIFLISALYHSRQQNLAGLEALPPSQRQALLWRLCWSEQYFRNGRLSDPYSTPGSDQCGPAKGP